MKKSFRRFLEKRKGPSRGPRTRYIKPDLNVDCKVPAPMSMPLSRTFTVRLSNTLSASTTGAGVINTIIQADPSSVTSATFGTITQFPEWATWAGLFSEVKLIQFECRFTPIYIDDTKGDLAFPLAIGGDLDPEIKIPGSFANVMDDADSQSWTPTRDYSGRSKYHAIRPGPWGLPWASSQAPNPGFSNGIAAGCPGGIQLYLSGGPVSTAVFDVTITGYYKLRSKG